MTQSAVARFEAGGTVPTLSVLERLAAAMDVRLRVGFEVGLVLARPVTAVVASPAFDAAAMDGFAVAGPGPWTVIGRILAGRSRRQGRWGGPGRARRPDHRDRLVISSSTMPRAAFNGSVGSRV